MTELERFAAQGKALSDLKNARANAATLKLTLLAYGRRLHEVSGVVFPFVENPEAVDASSCVKLCDHLKASIQQFSTPDGILPLIDELLEARDQPAARTDRSAPGTASRGPDSLPLCRRHHDKKGWPEKRRSVS